MDDLLETARETLERYEEGSLDVGDELYDEIDPDVEYCFWDYPFDVYDEKVSEGEVFLVGVEHEPSFFSKYWSLFDDYIAGNDALMVENPGAGEFYESEFYGEIGMQAMNNDKPVYVSDPELKISNTAEKILGGAALAVVGKQLFDIFGGHETVLENISEFIGFSYGYLGTLPGRRAVSRQGFEEISRYGVGFNDYREVMVADGIIRTLEEEEVGSVVNIMGAGHTQGVKQYLENDWYREFKKKLYKPLRVFENYQIKKYGSKELTAEWELEKVLE